MSNPVFIIAEAGVNHNGRLDLALQLVDAARAAGADAIKFQTFLTEKILTRSVAKADYQRENVGEEGNQFDLIKDLELSWEDFRRIKDHCDAKGIRFLSTPDEEWSLDFLVNELQIPLIKVGSTEVDNLPFLRKIASKGLPVILSTGMSGLGEVERAVGVLRVGGAGELTLLHCTTNYPCPAQEVNLRAMATLRKAFRTPVGYSDHTLGIEIPLAAAALGATVIEKHFTLDQCMPGPDHRASLDPSQLKAMVDGIRVIEQALGDGIKRPNPSEERIKPLVRKRLVAARDLKAGTHLDEVDISRKRASAGITADHLELILGRKLGTDAAADEPLTWEHFFL